VLDEGLAADRMEQEEGSPKARKHSLKGFILLEDGIFDSAQEEAEKAESIYRRLYPDNKLWGRYHQIHLLSESGRIEKAEQVAEALRSDIGEDAEGNISFLWYAQGCIDFFKGNLEESIVNLEKSADRIREFFPHYMLARAYLESGKLDKGVGQLERILSKYDETRAGLGSWAVKAHYLLGLAYERSGWNDKAVEKYEEFLEIWKDADSGMPEVEDARQRLAKLKTKV
jgi:tetratricopeptide (TPR) repeat protein